MFFQISSAVTTDSQPQAVHSAQPKDDPLNSFIYPVRVNPVLFTHRGKLGALRDTNTTFPPLFHLKN